MKKAFFLLAVLLLSTHLLKAQFDDKFYFPNKTWKALDSSMQVEEVNLPVDTVTLNALFFKPVGQPKATVLFCHGAGGNVTFYQYMVKPLVEHGYQVFMIDFRGYGKSSGKPTHLNIACDGQVVFDYLLGRPDVKGTKMLLFGASIGTQVATRLARDNGDKIQALVLDGAISSFTDLAAAYAPAEQQAMIKQYLTSPYAAKTDIPFVKLPVLIVHSKEDKEVPFALAEAVYNAAIGKKELYIYSGTHLAAMKENAGEYVNKIDRLIY
ncbi:alpha/beta hydrolase [Chitinophaga pinensis]|uniref:Lysophospholipase-like protein n=1 Tax=Chitinophaga pinensis (strain ATCC 43595 / DSM 2588 / LMG 13176 / NBRC 15968 / NCIMB 11800 / UQM 2034) TaxID=485918 RepID=A0A979G907_CHIPD|nr:alpha/beta fold hydrolase [Chitinophaga pinensis]ACU62965.1 Lysophospholipase-like protein [Chitinophaga pinensis DSM 2588]